ncbi:MAG: MFS transporter [Chitinophagaceae bacterium]
MNDSGTGSPISIKSFRHFLVARFTFIMALQMVSFAIALYMYALTGSKLSLGLLGLSEVIPAITFALYAGHVIDRSDKRTLLLRNMLLYFMAVIGLGFIASNYAKQNFSTGILEYSIYSLIFLTGIFRAFTGPAMGSIVAQLVPKEQLATAISWSSASWQTASVVGPIASGILIDSVGTFTTFSIAVGLLLIAIATIYLVPKQPVVHANKEQKTWESVKEGIRYVWETKTLLSALSLDMFAVFFGGATALLPVFGKDILHLDATGISILKASQGIGSILILLWLTRRPLKNAQGKTLLYCVAAFGIMMIVFAISKSFWLSLGALFLAGVFDGISMLVRGTVLQMFVPDDMRGRVSSVSSMFINSSNELGAFESGVAAQALGTVPSVIFGGCMTIVVVAITWNKAPSLRKMEY